MSIEGDIGGRTASEPGSGHSARSLWVALALAGASLLVFAPVWRYGFLSYDDAQFVTENPVVLGGLTWRGAAWALTTGYFSYWQPLTWLSHMLDVQLFGLNGGAHHLVNLLLHIAATLALFAALRQTTQRFWRSAFVAALFAVHPLHVQTVAWVAERKGVLSTLLWMLTLWAYCSYVRRPGWKRYLPVLALFALGLTAKPMLVTLPAVLLLLDFWPLGRVSLGPEASKSLRETGPRLIIEKLPLAALAVASSAVTLLVVARQGNLISPVDFHPALAVAYTAMSYTAYIGKMLWPAGLSAFYPFPRALYGWWVVASALAIFAVSLAAIREAPRRPYFAVGWFWYLVTMLPVIGLVQSQGQTMADRYTYVPLIGPFIMAAWGLPELLHRLSRRWFALGAATVLSACMVVARREARYWESDTALWTHALEVTSGNHIAHNNLGIPLAAQGRQEDAMEHFSAALRIKPDYPEAHNNLGNCLLNRGRVDEAISHYAAALRLNSAYTKAHINLGVALASQGRASDAALQFDEALRGAPDSPEAHFNLGLVLRLLGRTREAIRHLEISLRFKPDQPDARRALDELRSQAAPTRPPGRPSATASGKLASARRLNDLGASLLNQGRESEAIRRFSEALRLEPDLVEARINLGIALARQGRGDEAMLEFSSALRAAPGSPDVHYNLAVLLAGKGRTGEAIRHLEAALKVNPSHRDSRNALGELRAKTAR